MKRSNIITMIAMVLSCVISSQAWATIYLQNNYQAPIQFVQKSADTAHMYEAKTLGNGARERLKTEENVRDVFNPGKLYLSIRTVGGRYSDLSYLFDKIAKEQRSHPDKDPIIMINPSYGVYGWNIMIEWDLRTR